MNQRSVHIGLLALVAGTIFFANLGGAKLWDRDEPRNAGCALEMMERGNFIVPTFNDELRHQKPALLYWLIASAYSVFGVNEFSARFWSALLAVGTVCCTYSIAAKLFDRRIAFLAGIILATSIMFGLAARAATPDSVLIFCSTLALLIYVRAVFDKRRICDTQNQNIPEAMNWFPGRWRTILAMYAVMGVGVLAKGPVAFVLPMAIIGMFMLIGRLPIQSASLEERRSWLSRLTSWMRPFHPWHFLKILWAMKPVVAVAVILLVAAPWYIAVGIQTDGEWLRRFFLNEHFGRATTVLENHSGGPWYYPATILLGFFPWSVFAIPVILFCRSAIRNGTPESKGIVFLTCWILVQISIFTIASTKLPSYVTPCYPALAILTSVFLVRFATSMAGQPKFWPWVSSCSLVLAGVAITLTVAMAATHYLPGEEWLALIGGIPIVGGLIALWFLAKGRPRSWLASIGTTATIFALVLFGCATDAVDRHQQNDELLATITAANKDTGIASFGQLESTWVYYSGRPIYELLEAGGVKQMPKRRSFWQHKPRVTPEVFAREHPYTLVLTSDADLDRFNSTIDSSFVTELGRTKYFLKKKELVLLKVTLPRHADATNFGERLQR